MIGTVLLIVMMVLGVLWLTGPWEGLDLRRRQAAESIVFTGLLVVPAVTFGWALLASRACEVRLPALVPVAFVIVAAAAAPAVFTFATGGRGESLLGPAFIYTFIGLPAIAVEAAGIGVLLARLLKLSGPEREGPKRSAT